jgi:hypothetical protein
MVPVLTYIQNVGGYDVYWEREQVGTVRKLGHRWQATLPNGNTFPSFSTRRAAGERLRQTAEGRRVA